MSDVVQNNVSLDEFDRYLSGVIASAVKTIFAPDAMKSMTPDMLKDIIQQHLEGVVITALKKEEIVEAIFKSRGFDSLYEGIYSEDIGEEAKQVVIKLFVLDVLTIHFLASLNQHASVLKNMLEEAQQKVEQEVKDQMADAEVPKEPAEDDTSEPPVLSEGVTKRVKSLKSVARAKSKM